MDEPRIRAATAADVPAITDSAEQAYRHYIARIVKPPGPMLDNYMAIVKFASTRIKRGGESASLRFDRL